VGPATAGEEALVLSVGFITHRLEAMCFTGSLLASVPNAEALPPLR
jgi:hypothetical protein